MEGILLHVLYRGEKAGDFAAEMERSGLRAAVLAEEGCMQYDYYRAARSPPQQERRADGASQGTQGKL